MIVDQFGIGGHIGFNYSQPVLILSCQFLKVQVGFVNALYGLVRPAQGQVIHIPLVTPENQAGDKYCSQ